MHRHIVGLGLVAAVLLVPVNTLHAADLEQIPAELVGKLAPVLAEKGAQVAKTPVVIEADLEKANGFHVPHKLGALVVPHKGLAETAEQAEKFKADKGASLAYLFVYQLVPVVDGQKVAASRLPAITIQDDQGNSRELHVLVLAVRQLAEDDYRLYVYGKDDKPLVDAKFAEGTGPGPVPVAIDAKDPNETTKEGKLVVTVFGKYQASFTAGFTGE